MDAATHRQYNRKWQRANPDKWHAIRNRHYAKHKSEIQAKRKAYFAAHPEKVNNTHLRVKEWFRKYKSSLCCQLCGEADPRTLDFHHREKKENRNRTIAYMTNRSLNQLQAEIAKCDVLCANCHRKITIKF